MPIGTQNPEEKFIPTGEGNRRPDTSSTGTIAERWLDLPDGRMRYLQAGSGPPLILVHGLMGYSFSWRFTMPALASHATVYAIDNLGAGFSPARDAMDCTLRATAERVLQFADALGIPDFDLLGTSHGGGVAIMVAAICAERQKELRQADLPAKLRSAELRPQSCDLQSHDQQHSTTLACSAWCSWRRSIHGRLTADGWRLFSPAQSARCCSATPSNAGDLSITCGSAACSPTEQRFRPIRSRDTACR